MFRMSAVNRSLFRGVQKRFGGSAPNTASQNMANTVALGIFGTGVGFCFLELWQGACAQSTAARKQVHDALKNARLTEKKD